MTLSADMPAGAAGVMRIEIHNWIAADQEATRIPALKELAACSRLAASSNNLAQALQKVFAQLPGLADKLQDLFEEVLKSDGGASVGSVTAIYMPAMAAILQMQGQPAGFDPNAPLMEIRMELAAFSTDPLPDTAVQIPADYKEASIGDLIKAQLAAVRVPTTSGPVTSAQVPLPPGLSRPVLVSSRPPAYTEGARLAKIEGRVSLSLVVNASGDPQNIQVIQSLDPGLDQEAIEAVKGWKFQPGLKDGNPVAVRVTIQVNFQLRDKPPAQQQ